MLATTGANDEPSVRARLGLDRLAEIARETTGARYVALAVLNEERTELEHLSAAGLDEHPRWAIGHVPPGCGVLADLILAPGLMLIGDVRRHPRSNGLPPDHRVRRSFVGVALKIDGQVCGSLRLAEKASGEFTREDQAVAIALAEEAANRIRFERRGLKWPSNGISGLGPLVKRTKETFKSLGGGAPLPARRSGQRGDIEGVL
jgi:GAF domain-containing protein